MVMKQRQDGAAAAEVGIAGPDVETGPGGHDYGRAGAYTGAGADVVAMVRAINEAEFGGWFDIADVLAVIQIESSFRPGAYRAEPQINDASYGLMQILSRTAADRGYDGPPEGLYDPETNILFGMRHLRWSWDYLARRMGSAPPRSLWIGSYNAGVGNAMKGYTPYAYVMKFEAARLLWAARI
ncbi:lytic transglycosylase domain-containing protein [Magnetospirillum sp. ME-1]|uniref:lytic transglycosylase domain-containing protein n=1 Tax=Magnetospirillum sp. ME-1 TaxID=1639348 RepID=UPI00143D3815|nr:lytic transglycosylase domain-containing protein [Magnetospirillum sp. ME-1]